MQDEAHADLSVLGPALFKHGSEGAVSEAGNQHLPLPTPPIPLNEAATAFQCCKLDDMSQPRTGTQYLCLFMMPVCLADFTLIDKQL